jgi:hypothetical protein
MAHRLLQCAGPLPGAAPSPALGDGGNWRYTGPMNPLRIAALVALALFMPAFAQAQWQWIDKDGRKVFSDQAPPPDIPAKNIIKQPGARSKAVSAPEPAAAVGAASAPAAVAVKPPASAPKVSGRDRELQDKKKQADAAEAEKKKAEEEKLAQMRDENCGRLRQQRAAITSGARVARNNAAGERVFLDEAGIAAEAKRLQGIIDSQCQ